MHSIVLALHPMCGHLHTGSILAIYKENQYMVKFMKPELPTQKILDINMSTQFTESYSNSKLATVEAVGDRYHHQGQGSVVNNENMYADVVESVNFDITAFLINLLTLKSGLVEELRRLNDFVKEQRDNVIVKHEG